MWLGGKSEDHICFHILTSDATSWQGRAEKTFGTNPGLNFSHAPLFPTNEKTKPTFVFNTTAEGNLRRGGCAPGVNDS